jgi:hypothetical protein
VQVVRNVGRVKAQQRRGRWLTAVGLAALTLAFVLGVVWQQRRVGLILVSYAAMATGFVLFNMGLQLVAKWGRKPRNDQQLDKALERLSDRYTLIHFAALGKRYPEHLLVHHSGVLVLTVRELPGQISVNGRRWRRGGNPLGRFFSYSGPQLGNPTLENEGDVETVKAYLAERGLPDAVDSVIVFTNPTVTVRVTDSPVQVVDLDGLPAFVRDVGRERAQLSGKDRLAIVEALSQGEDLEQVTLRAERRPRRAA